METFASIDKSNSVDSQPVEFQVGEKRSIWKFSYRGANIARLMPPHLNIEDVAPDFAKELPARFHDDRLIRSNLSETSAVVLHSPEGEEVVAAEQEFVVGFQEISQTEIAAFESEQQLERRFFDSRGLFGVYRTQIESPSQFISAVESDERVLYIDPNILDGDEGEVIQDDFNSGQEDVTFPHSLWNHEMVGVDSNGSASDGEGVVVAVVDGLIDFEHPALREALLVQSESPELKFGERLQIVEHGMACMSVIAGQTILPNGKKLGVSPSAKLLPIAISTYSADPYVWRASAIEFLAEVATNGSMTDPHSSDVIPIERLIVNCSWRLRLQRPQLSAVARAFQKLTSGRAVCVCSAGNKGTDSRHLPSEYPGVIRVAALGIDGKKLTRPGLSSNFGSTVDFCAPGGTGAPNDADDILVATVNEIHSFAIGTSFAAPHVAGILAAIWSRNPAFSREELLEFVVNNLTQSVDADNPDFTGKLGALLKL